MIHPSTQLRWRSDELGFGVFATDDIPIGTVTVAPDPFDLNISKEKLDQLPSMLRDSLWHFMYHRTAQELVLSWDHARYINHHCQANTMLTHLGIEIAVRPIKAGDEITTEYGLLGVQEEMELCCACSPCRQILRPNDREQFGANWLNLIHSALAQVNSVEQPLKALFEHLSIC